MAVRIIFLKLVLGVGVVEAITENLYGNSQIQQNFFIWNLKGPSLTVRSTRGAK